MGLSAGKVEVQITSEKPDFITRLVSGSFTSMGIYKSLVSSDCTLEVDLSRVPLSLIHSEPIIHSWNVRRFFR